MSTLIEVQKLTKVYRMGDVEVQALKGVSLAIEEGEMVAIMGPSGSGKSTLMNIIGCLDQPSDGSYLLDGVDVGGLSDNQLAAIRNQKIGFVFQQYMLLQRTSALRNVELPLLYGGKGDRQGRAMAALSAVGMAERSHHKPNELSGGQQQRVAVARALAVRPKLLLLDEPFSALDRKLRETMQIELRRLLRELGTTSVFVTHDQDEALTMSDRIAVMNRGAIEQFATPEAIYKRPQTSFVLEFVGLSARLKGRVASSEGSLLSVDTALGPLKVRGSYMKGAEVLLAVRPERIRVDQPGENSITAPLRDAVFQGSKIQLHFAAGDGEQLTVETADLPGGVPAPGTRLALGWSIADTLVYPAP